MSKGYKDGVGRHQRVFNMMRKKVPDIGYTGVCWVDAFACMYRLYLDFVNYPRLKSRASLARRDNDLKYCP